MNSEQKYFMLHTLAYLSYILIISFVQFILKLDTFMLGLTICLVLFLHTYLEFVKINPLIKKLGRLEGINSTMKYVTDRLKEARKKKRK